MLAAWPQHTKHTADWTVDMSHSNRQPELWPPEHASGSKLTGYANIHCTAAGTSTPIHTAPNWRRKQWQGDLERCAWNQPSTNAAEAVTLCNTPDANPTGQNTTAVHNYTGKRQQPRSADTRPHELRRMSIYVKQESPVITRDAAVYLRTVRLPWSAVNSADMTCTISVHPL